MKPAARHTRVGQLLRAARLAPVGLGGSSGVRISADPRPTTNGRIACSQALLSGLRVPDSGSHQREGALTWSRLSCSQPNLAHRLTCTARGARCLAVATQLEPQRAAARAHPRPRCRARSYVGHVVDLGPPARRGAPTGSAGCTGLRSQGSVAMPSNASIRLKAPGCDHPVRHRAPCEAREGDAASVDPASLSAAGGGAIRTAGCSSSPEPSR